MTSCLALQSHLSQLEASAKTTLREWEERRRAADLAEKRRVAPGWLDGDIKLLVPDAGEKDRAIGRAEGEARPQQQRRTSVGIKGLIERRDGVQDSREADEIDKVFGGLGIK